MYGGGRRPLTRARIETQSLSVLGRQAACRPLTRARIETPALPCIFSSLRVALSRGRGSKRPGHPPRVVPARRPLTRARIETGNPVELDAALRVALSRGRGSKQHIGKGIAAGEPSPSHEGADRNNFQNAKRNSPIVALSRGRGSKHRSPCPPLSDAGRPLTRARIETS